MNVLAVLLHPLLHFICTFNRGSFFSVCSFLDKQCWLLRWLNRLVFVLLSEAMHKLELININKTWVLIIYLPCANVNYACFWYFSCKVHFMVVDMDFGILCYTSSLKSSVLVFSVAYSWNCTTHFLILYLHRLVWSYADTISYGESNMTNRPDKSTVLCNLCENNKAELWIFSNSEFLGF